MPITAEDLAKQREYIYEQLRLKLPSSEFSLVLPVHQISAAFALGIPAEKFNGFCHGYNKYWRRVLLNPATSQPIANINETLAATPEVQRWQREFLFGYTFNKFHNATIKHCNTHSELITYIVQQVVSPNIARNRVLTIGLSSVPTFSIFNPAPASFYRWFPQFIRRMHEVSIYLDDSDNLHFLDANIGWFKSTNSNISLETLQGFLNLIFDIMQYHNLTVGVLLQQYTLSFTPYTVKSKPVLSFSY